MARFLPEPLPTIRSRSRLWLLALFASLAFSGGLPARVAHGAGHPLDGVRWSPAEGRALDDAEVLDRLARADVAVLGEVHDNATHHRLQHDLLAALIRAGRRPALALEQFDREHQAALDAAAAATGVDAERMAAAGRFDDKGWRWPDYRSLVVAALDARLPLVAANLSRARARVIARGTGSDLDAATMLALERVRDPGLQAAIEADLVDGHCGERPEAGLLGRMVEAQRARDALMATSVTPHLARGVVLIAGYGHARRDRGMPRYLPPGTRVASLGFIEVDPGKLQVSDYAAARGGGAAEFDIVWFTPRAAREDPCKGFRLSR